MSMRQVTAAESTPPENAPAGGKVFSFFVTTDGDILSVGFVDVDSSAPLFQHSVGGNNSPAETPIFMIYPPLGADSWINTPGNTSILGVDMPGDGTANSAWGDLSNDGPQTNFKFAQLTFPPGTSWRFRGNVTIAGATGPFSVPFDFVPEPGSSMLALVGMLGLTGIRRRFNA
jgi:hypothetical protein